MNMLRKHVKVEPERWYYWCDKLGLLVWQDMPSGDTFIGGDQPDLTRTPESAKQFELELEGDDRGASQSSLDRHVGAVQRGLGPVRHAADRRPDQEATIPPGWSTTPAAGPTAAWAM